MDTVGAWSSKDTASLLTFFSQAVVQKTWSGDAKDIILKLPYGFFAALDGAHERCDIQWQDVRLFVVAFVLPSRFQLVDDHEQDGDQ